MIPQSLADVMNGVVVSINFMYIVIIFVVFILIVVCVVIRFRLNIFIIFVFVIIMGGQETRPTLISRVRDLQTKNDLE